jgi:hypothetical protein
MAIATSADSSVKSGTQLIGTVKETSHEYMNGIVYPSSVVTMATSKPSSLLGGFLGDYKELQSYK